MRYYIDTEFHEEPGHLQLISIGVESEEGEQFYGVSTDADIPYIVEVNSWVRDNVLPHVATPFNQAGESSKPEVLVRGPEVEIAQALLATYGLGTDPHPEFWGYFADYDWVLFCRLFGRMVDLPENFPRYCLDIKQEMRGYGLTRDDMPKFEGTPHSAIDDAHLHRMMHEYVRDWSAP